MTRSVINTAMRICLIILSGVLLFLIAGCQSESRTTTLSSAPVHYSLQVGVMPAVDSAPIFYADQMDIFAGLGLDVTVQVYTNAMSRQSALLSGELDGAMTDVIALVNNVDNGFDIKVTTSTDGIFPFLMKEDITGKTSLKAAVMEVSVTNYLTDRILGSQYRLDKIYINEIPARMEMVGKGSLDIAIIPEPMASQGEIGGLIKKLYPSDDTFSPEVMVFTGQAIQEKAEAIRLFHEGYNLAVSAINADDARARDILINTLQLNSAIKDKIIMPTYHKARVPDKDYLAQVIIWNEKVLGQKTELTYDQMVDASFIG
ncbi:MAG: ABC transporter substrate-binding protein [Bacillota bacterium]|nr:ABC transporter substrate-binding protein [Bacillota bacterium]